MLAASSGMTHLSHLVFLVLGGLGLFVKFNFSLCHMRCLKLGYLGTLNALQMKVKCSPWGSVCVEPGMWDVAVLLSSFSLEEAGNCYLISEWCLLAWRMSSLSTTDVSRGPGCFCHCHCQGGAALLQKGGCSCPVGPPAGSGTAGGWGWAVLP